jgi:uncharacterized protein (UPF0332 family)
MQKAGRALEAAHLLFANHDMEGACNRAYYAMFDAAHAALWAAGVQAPGAIVKSHAGLVSLFAQELVKEGKVGIEHGRAFGRVQKTRLLADYTADPPATLETQEAIGLAEAFVAAIGSMIAGLGPDDARRSR